MTNSDSVFFCDASLNSKRKAEIVSKYFAAWAKIMSTRQYVQKISYIDLFSGVGEYEDGHKSTPILILQSAINDNKIASKLEARFNDESEEIVLKLKKAIKNIPGIEKLKNYPKVFNTKIGYDFSSHIQPNRNNPTFTFVDPFGYKGISRDLIKKLLNGFGCDVVFFFNYNRINAGITNTKISKYIESIFGHKEAISLRQELTGKKTSDRELLILNSLIKSLNTIGGNFVLPFKFYHLSRNATSHFIIFVTKHELGYDIMKSIMFPYRNRINYRLNCLEFSPKLYIQPSLFDVDEHWLEKQLMDLYKHKTTTAGDIYRMNFQTPYPIKEYRSALLKLEAKNKIITNPPASKRNKNTMAEHVIVQFL